MMFLRPCGGTCFWKGINTPKRNGQEKQRLDFHFRDLVGVFLVLSDSATAFIPDGRKEGRERFMLLQTGKSLGSDLEQINPASIGTSHRTLHGRLSSNRPVSIRLIEANTG